MDILRITGRRVLPPPSFMLLGYVALLREAARADAERREVARTPEARTAPARSHRPGESYREGGKVKNRTVANLSSWPEANGL